MLLSIVITINVRKEIYYIPKFSVIIDLVYVMGHIMPESFYV